jgi:glycosyltransferase involved in cell wall biosynthesis
MKKAHLNHMKAFSPPQFRNHQLDLTCDKECGLYGNTIDATGNVEQEEMCLECPFVVCHDDPAVLDAIVADLWSHTSLDTLPDGALMLFWPLIQYLWEHQFDVVILANKAGRDYYLLHLVGLVLPRAVRIGDLSMRFGLLPLPSERLPFDAFVGPSLYVALHPSVTQHRIPTFVLPCAIDPDVFSVEHALSTASKLGRRGSASEFVPAEFCGGQFRNAHCSVKHDQSKDCDPRAAMLVFAFIGRLSPEKGVGLFVAAASTVSKAIPNARFLIVGGAGPNEQNYEAGVVDLLHRYEVANKVLLPLEWSLRSRDFTGRSMLVSLFVVQTYITGFLPPDAIAAVNLCVDVLVAPYIRPAMETFAQVIVEAMAMRVPVLSFGVGGINVSSGFCAVVSSRLFVLDRVMIT